MKKSFKSLKKQTQNQLDKTVKLLSVINRAITDLNKSEKSVKFLEDVSNLVGILEYDEMPEKNEVVDLFKFPIEVLYVTFVGYLLKDPVFKSFDLEDSTFIYKLRTLLSENDDSLRIEEHVIGHLIEGRHALGISVNFDEAGLNIRAFTRDVSQYGYARARKMWQLIESMEINLKQQVFANDLYRFVLDLSLDITLENSVSVGRKVFQFRLGKESLPMIRDIEIVNAEEFGLEIARDKKSMRVLVNLISGVLGLGESWNNELYRLADIISRHYCTEEVSYIFIVDGGISVEFI